MRSAPLLRDAGRKHAYSHICDSNMWWTTVTVGWMEHRGWRHIHVHQSKSFETSLPITHLPLCPDMHPPKHLPIHQTGSPPRCWRPGSITTLWQASVRRVAVQSQTSWWCSDGSPLLGMIGRAQEKTCDHRHKILAHEEVANHSKGQGHHNGQSKSVFIQW